MEVTNAIGRKVSLLNHDAPAYSSSHHRPPRPCDHSRHSSHSTQMSRDESDSSPTSSISLATPAFSPRPTPQLARFDSSSSQASLQTPSPMTPNYPLDPLDQSKTVPPHDPYYRPHALFYAPPPPSQSDLSSQAYFALPMREELLMEASYASLDVATLPHQFSYPPPLLGAPVLPPSGLPPSSLVPAIPASVAATAAAATVPVSANASKIVKKKYACPHAARYACPDTFTTSGHAARHGKKHTGEKNILCPTCNKAFTRKDNMKQHERTHKSTGESASSSASTTLSPSTSGYATASSGRRAPDVISPSSTTTSPVMAMDDPEPEDWITGPSHSSPDANAHAKRPGARRFGPTHPLGYTDSQLSIDVRLAQGSRSTFD